MSLLDLVLVSSRSMALRVRLTNAICFDGFIVYEPPLAPDETWDPSLAKKPMCSSVSTSHLELWQVEDSRAHVEVVDVLSLPDRRHLNF